jgi:hypothetical protein
MTLYSVIANAGISASRALKIGDYCFMYTEKGIVLVQGL